MSAIVDRWLADVTAEVAQLSTTPQDDMGAARLAYLTARRDALYAMRAGELKVRVDLFRTSGKWYTEEDWTVPVDALNPADLERSPDARSIEGGPVLVPSVEPFGFPCLLLGLPARSPS